MYNLIKVTPKPIEYEAFQFTKDTTSLPKNFRGAIMHQGRNNPYIVMEVAGNELVYNPGRWFVKTGNSAWRVVSEHTFNNLYSIVSSETMEAAYNPAIPTGSWT